MTNQVTDRSQEHESGARLTPRGPRLAVVMPTFNREAGVRRCFRSLLEQSIDLDWFCVVVDDASDPPPDFSDLIQDDPRFVYERLSQNSGPLIARNRGIDIAIGSHAGLVAFIDDDDYFCPDFFKYVLEVFVQNPNIGWYVSRCMFVGQRIPLEKWPEHDGIYDYFYDVQLNRSFTSDVTHVISTSRIGKSRFSTRGRHQREWTFLYKIAKAGGFYASNHVTKVAEYRDDGLTLNSPQYNSDFIYCWNYLSKTYTYIRYRPLSIKAWKFFIAQLIRFPVRIVCLSKNKAVLYVNNTGKSERVHRSTREGLRKGIERNR